MMKRRNYVREREKNEELVKMVLSVCGTFWSNNFWGNYKFKKDFFFFFMLC